MRLELIYFFLINVYLFTAYLTVILTHCRVSKCVSGNYVYYTFSSTTHSTLKCWRNESKMCIIFLLSLSKSKNNAFELSIYQFSYY
jgi:hypothetical protein